MLALLYQNAYPSNFTFLRLKIQLPLRTGFKKDRKSFLLVGFRPTLHICNEMLRAVIKNLDIKSVLQLMIKAYNIVF